MNIELRDLRWAVTAAQYRSLRQTAEALNVRQSTLSRRIRVLEDRVGGALFERTNGGSRPTVAGIEFVEFARWILEDTEAAFRKLQSRSRGEIGGLGIGVYASLATGNMRATLAEYHNRFPDVDVRTMDGSHGRLFGALDRSAIDVAIMTKSHEAWDDRSLPLWTERLIVALPEHHPLAEHEAISWRQLAQERILLPSLGPGLELESLLTSRLHGDKPRRVLHQEAGLDRLLGLVSTGFGALLMFEGGTGLKHDGVVYREVHDGAESTRVTFTAYWQQKNENPTLKPFLQLLRERYPDFSGAPAS